MSSNNNNNKTININRKHECGNVLLLDVVLCFFLLRGTRWWQLWPGIVSAFYLPLIPVTISSAAIKQCCSILKAADADRE